MGQSLKKLTPAGGSEEKQKVIDSILGRDYQKYFQDHPPKTKGEFYAAIFKTVEELNKHLRYTQVRAPSTDDLKRLFNTHHVDKDKPLSKDEFQKIMREISSSPDLSGVGITETLLYMFGVPLTTVFVKNRVMPDAISNDVFIPAVTSITAFFLAAFNKI